MPKLLGINSAGRSNIDSVFPTNMLIYTSAEVDSEFLPKVNNTLVISAAGSSSRTLQFQTAGSLRWTVGENATPETGSNVGSDFDLFAFADDGATASRVFRINRASKILAFDFGPTAPTATLGTSTTQLATTAFVQNAIGGIATGVTSFNSRTGTVVPAANDYTFAQLASKPTTISGYGITDFNSTGDARWVLKAGDNMTGALNINFSDTRLINITNTTGAPTSGGAGFLAYLGVQPTASGNRLGFNYFGSNVSGVTTNSAGISASAQEAWSVGTSQGTYLSFETTAIGTASRTEKVRIHASGNVSVGNTTDSGFKLDITGNIQSSGNITPSATNTVNLGASGANWGTVHTRVLASSTSIITSTASLVPNVTNTLNLGSASLTWANAYISAVTAGIIRPFTTGGIVYQSSSGVSIGALANNGNALFGGTTDGGYKVDSQVTGTNGFFRASNLVVDATGNVTSNTPTVGDNSTKVATTAFVLANSFVNPMTTLGDIIYGGTSGVPTRLAGNVMASIKFLASFGNGTVSNAPQYYDILNANQSFNGVNTFTFGLVVGGSTPITYNYGTFATNLQAATSTANRTITLPDKSGTVALLTDLATAARYTGSGNGSNLAIVIAHGLTGITSSSVISVTANNAAASGFTFATIDATNITITYSVAPASGTNNLAYSIIIK